jgi:hypothetical protein
MADKWDKYAVGSSTATATADPWGKYAVQDEAPQPDEEMVGPIRKSALEAAKKNISNQRATEVAAPGTGAFIEGALGDVFKHGTGAVRGILKSAKGALQMIPATFDAFARSPEGTEEERYQALGGNLGLAAHRLAQPSIQQVAKGADLIKAGAPEEGALTMGSALIPGGSDMLDAIKRGEGGEAVGVGLGNAAIARGISEIPGAVEAKFGKTAKAAKAAAKSSLAKLEIIQTLNPGPGQVERTISDIDTAMPEISKTAGGTQSITSTKTLRDAAINTSRRLYDSFKQNFLDPYRGKNATVGIDPTIRERASQLMTSHNRVAYPDIAKLVDGETLSLSEAQSALKDTNYILQSVMNKTPDKARVMRMDPEWGWLEDLRQNLRSNFFQAYPVEVQPFAQKAYSDIGAVNNIRNLSEVAHDASLKLPKESTSVYDPHLDLSGVPPSTMGGVASRIGLRTKTMQGLGVNHPDARIARAMKDLRVSEPQGFPEIPEELAVNFRDPGKPGPIGLGRASSGTGPRFSLNPRGMEATTLPDPRMVLNEPVMTPKPNPRDFQSNATMRHPATMPRPRSTPASRAESVPLSQKTFAEWKEAIRAKNPGVSESTLDSLTKAAQKLGVFPGEPN